MRFDPDLEYAEWAPIGIKFRKAKEWLQFAIGAWLNHGEAHYGEMYTQAAEETGLPEETLMIFKYVDSRVPEEVRILEDHMNWSHHRMVAKFPPEEQSKWLQMAHQNVWSVRDLKEALKKASGKDGDGQGEGEDKEGREEGPPTGEACVCCGSSPAGMKCCGSCMAVASKAVATIGVRGAIELLGRKPSKPQLAMLKWAYDFIKQPADQTPDEELEWEARYEALGKVAAKAAQ